MTNCRCRVTGLHAVGPNIYVLSFQAPEIASSVLPGQFVNVRVSDAGVPFLRRPFSVYHTERDTVQIIFNVIGLGTRTLSSKRVDDEIDVIGPLGRPYGVAGDYETALLVAGGLGVAPLPILTSALKNLSRAIVTFLGARTHDQLVVTHLHNVHAAADDGSAPFRGTVVDCLRDELVKQRYPRAKIFACGPNAMLRALAETAREFSLPCEVSLESAMACGIGICQGCPVETTDAAKKYALVCREGTVFDTRTIRIAPW